ncbi:hypothetical protein [Nostoc sp.]|uniref:hypothetical protein n=1 Tax=Nostoc sp. TaxID=1180 RepID=UPI002FF5DDE2
MPLFNLEPVNLIPTQFIQLLDKKDSGVNGGAAIVTTWTNKIINTINFDDTGLVGLSNNIFTLPQGTYEVAVSTTFYRLSNTKIRIYNITDNAILLQGINAYFLPSSESPALQASLSGKFNIGEEKQLSLQYWTEGNSNINQYNFGGTVSDGSPEIYTTIDLKKVG